MNDNGSSSDASINALELAEPGTVAALWKIKALTHLRFMVPSELTAHDLLALDRVLTSNGLVVGMMVGLRGLRRWSKRHRCPCREDDRILRAVFIL